MTIYGDLGGHDPLAPKALSKAEVGALLTRGAASAGITCIAEFSVRSSWTVKKNGDAKERAIDYVWAVRAAPPCKPGTDCHGGKWILLAAFEIEGYPAANDRLAPEKDADSLSCVARDVAAVCPDVKPILATILFTVHPSGLRPWRLGDSFATVAKTSMTMKGIVDRRIRKWIEEQRTSTTINTYLDRELIEPGTGSTPLIESWIDTCREVARELRDRGVAVK